MARRSVKRGPNLLTVRGGAFPCAAIALAVLLGSGPISGGAAHGSASVLSPAGLALSLAQGISVVADPADCTASTDGTARYFVSVRGSSGEDILHAVGRLFGTGSENAGQVVNMAIGDLEPQADDGSPPSCVPRPRDGHANDLGSVFVPAVAGTHTWSLRVLAAGYSPAPLIDLAPYVEGSVCPMGDGSGCLISLGTVVMAGSPLPSTSGGRTPTPPPPGLPRAPVPPPPAAVVARPTGTPVPTPTRTPSPSPDATGTLSPTPTVEPQAPTPAPVTESPTPAPLPPEPDQPPTAPPPSTEPVLLPPECPDALTCPEIGVPADPAMPSE